MTNSRILLGAICLISNLISLQAQSPTLYFPPKTGNAWQTISPASLGFCQERIDSLYQFLEDKNTKSFILLKDGKIVLEKYFGTFTQDSLWYWASAGKSLTGFMVGQAQEQGLLSLTDKSSKYLGAGWTSCPADKEDLITVRSHLTMTTGLEDFVTDDNCELPSCLTYKADAGTRWAYHNAPYRLIHSILEEASGTSINLFTKSKVFDRTGMKGLWLDHVMYSRTRDMARFGLLTLAKGVWDTDTLLHDQQYMYDMTHPSQQLNKGYGYLWWLNGQENYMLPSVQLVFPGKILPNAPDDLFAALGKNDQKIHVVPSKGWVVVRMGEDAGYNGPGGGQVPILFDIAMWDYLNQLECSGVATKEVPGNVLQINIAPNPATENWQVVSQAQISRLELYNSQGMLLRSVENQTSVNAADLVPGAYWLKVFAGDQYVVKLVTR